MNSDRPIILNPLFEQEELQRRQSDFIEYSNKLAEIHLDRQADHDCRHTEKIRQLQEYTDLQDKIEDMRRIMNDSRDLYRQRLLENERLRLQALAEQEKKLSNIEKETRRSTAKQTKKKKSIKKKK